MPAGIGSAPVWPQLTSLRCLRNSVPVMDDSLATLPAVQTCDLSSNNISIVQGLNACSSLTELILSNNCIESVAQIGLCSGPLRRLVLQVCILDSHSVHQHVCTSRALLRASETPGASDWNFRVPFNTSTCVAL